MGDTINSYKLMAPPFWDLYDDLQAGLHSEYWLKGGRGSTKSSFISLAIIIGMLRDRNANAIVYRQVGNTIKDSVYAQMIWAINALGIGSICKLRSSPYEIMFKPTGQRILFRGTDDPMKSKSIKLTKGYFKYLWFEELAEFRNMESIRTIKQSILRGVDKAFTLYSYNPPRSAQSWVNDEGLKNIETRYVHASTYLDVPKEWLGDVFISEAEQLKKTNPLAYQNEYMGEITGNGGAVFENVAVRDVTLDEIKTLGYFYQGIDWGWFPDPFQWVRCAYDAKKRELYIIDEFRANKLGNYAAFCTVKDRLNPNEPLTADSAEPKSIGDWREYGAYWIRAAVKGPGSVDYTMKWLSSLSKIVIDKKCVHAAKEFLSYEYEKNSDGQFISGYPDANNHCLTGDTLVETVDGAMPIKNLTGKSGFLYCFDEEKGNPVCGFFHDVRLTGIEDIFEFELEDGKCLRCSGEHLILTENGWKKAESLTKEDRIVETDIRGDYMDVYYSGDKKIAFFDGLYYIRDDKTGYYLNSTQKKRLHRAVYEFYNGQIPTGYEIHHIDHDKTNNDISNLLLVTENDHHRIHAEELNDSQRKARRDNMLLTAIPAAAKWHKSAEGREWHKQHYEKTKSTLHEKVTKSCKNCGKSFESGRNGLFCSNACKSAWRRKSGDDLIEQKCSYCGKIFNTNKFKQSETCSKSCAAKMRWHKKHSSASCRAGL